MGSTKRSPRQPPIELGADAEIDRRGFPPAEGSFPAAQDGADATGPVSEPSVPWQSTAATPTGSPRPSNERAADPS